jgi:dihydrofolate reductase
MAASLDGFIARKDGRVDWLETSDEFSGGDTLDPGFVEAFLKTIDCYVMGSRTYETALSFEGKGLGWSYGDKPTFVLTSRHLPRTRDTVEFYADDLAQFVNGHLRPTFSTIWFVGGGVVSGECLRLGLADEVRSSSSSTETSRSIWRRSKPTRAAWWSFVTRCEGIVASHGTPPPNQGMERTATRQENYKGEIRNRKLKSELALGSGRSSCSRWVPQLNQPRSGSR